MAAYSGGEDMNAKRLFVAVHAGAGYHSHEKVSEYKSLCRKAVLQAMSLLKKRKSAVEAVTAAVSILEHSELSNAGRGSNLTLSGSVECDASVMDGTTSLFGAVGCVSGILNPVKVACRLLESQQQGCLSLGRIPPSVLVGAGACDWAKQHGFTCDDAHKLKTDNTVRLYQKYKRKVDRAEMHNHVKKLCHTHNDSASVTKKPYSQTIEESTALSSNCNETHTNPKNMHVYSNLQNKSTTPERLLPNLHMEQGEIHQGLNSIESNMKNSYNTEKEAKELKQNSLEMEDDSGPVHGDSPAQDTVGALCIDWEGHISAAVSSGGIWLKHPGRLGPAAMYGAGCWAQNGDGELPGVAVITSGSGEHVMRTLLAKTCADSLSSAQDAVEGFNSCFTKHFMGSRLLSGVEKKLAGVVAVKTTQTEDCIPDVEVFWGHTTDSLALGYMRGDNQTPKTLISKLGEGSEAGKSFTMSSDFYSNHR